MSPNPDPSPSVEPPEEELADPDLDQTQRAQGDLGEWVVVAKNRRVNRDWLDLIQRHPENAKRCYEFLKRHPM